VFDHVTIRVADRAASEAFYSTVLQPLGMESTYSDARFAEWDDFSLTAADARHPVTRRLHIAFGARSRELLHLEIPPRQYAVFEHRGHVSTIFETYRSVWNEAIPATGRAVADAPVIERHNSVFNPRTGEGGLTLWIPLAS